MKTYDIIAQSVAHPNINAIARATGLSRKHVDNFLIEQNIHSILPDQIQPGESKMVASKHWNITVLCIKEE